MRLVVDSNRMNSQELAAFLESSHLHRAVITDYAWMEAYKSNSVAGLKRAFSILRDFPDQTDNLLRTKRIAGMDFRGACLGDKMIQRRAARDFKVTLSQIDRLDERSLLPLAAITPHVHAAQAHLEERMLGDMTNIREAFPMMQSLFSDAQISSIRGNDRMDPDLAHKIAHIIEETAKNLSLNFPNKLNRVTRNCYFDTFITRSAVAVSIYLLQWIRDGSQKDKGLKKFRNDLVDLNFAIYGTYFNGVLSNDQNLLRYHEELRVALKCFGARVPSEFKFDHDQGRGNRKGA
jgi:hypothetical protein